MMSCRATQRTGFTLVEILVALAILVMVLAAVSQIVATGTQASTNAALTSQAILRCESVMAEILAGVHEKQTSRDNRFSDGSENWYWSLQVTDTPVTDLLMLEVTAYHQQNNLINSEWTLSRWIRTDEALIESGEMSSDTVTTDTSR